MTPTNTTLLRHVELEAYTGRKWQLKLYDTGKRHSRGTTMLGYELISPEGIVLFQGQDFSASPMDATSLARGVLVP